MNDKMTDMEAALALCQLQRLKEVTHREEEKGSRKGMPKRFPPHLKLENCMSCPASERTRCGIATRCWSKKRRPREAKKRLAATGIGAAEPVADWRAGMRPPMSAGGYGLQTHCFPAALPLLDHARAGGCSRRLPQGFAEYSLKG